MGIGISDFKMTSDSMIFFCLERSYLYIYFFCFYSDFF